MLKNKTALSLSPLALLTLAACGGTKSSITSTTGAVQNGPLEGAFAFLDLHTGSNFQGDGVYDENTEQGMATEGTGSANGAGGYSLSEPASGTYSLIATTSGATIDIDTGTAYGDGITLKAPEGSTVITPQTTMIEAIVAATGVAPTAAAVSTASATVATAMGIVLPAGQTLASFDAYAAGVDPALKLSMQKANNNVMTVVKTMASAAEGLGVGAAAASHLAFTGMLAQVEKGAQIDFTNNATLVAIQGEVETAFGTYALTAEGAALNGGTGVIPAYFTTVLNDSIAEIKEVTDQIALLLVTDSDDARAAVFKVISTLADTVETFSQGVKTDLGVVTLLNTLDFDTTAQIANTAPTDITLAGSTFLNADTTDTTYSATSAETVAFLETSSSLVVGALTGVDAETAAGSLTYAIAGGTDAAFFEITGGNNLTFKTQPDYESGKISYSVAVSVADALGMQKIETFTVTITDDTSEGGAFGVNSDAVVWTDYQPATVSSLGAVVAGKDITNAVMSSTNGSAVTIGDSSIGTYLNLPNLINLTNSSFVGTAKSPVLKFTLDSVPTGSGNATITATITDGADASRTAGTEDQITLTVNVAYLGDGTTATLSVPAGTATGTFVKADGTTATFSLANAEVDAFDITASNPVTGLPASLDVKIGGLYEAFISGAGNSTLLQEGTYNIAVETTLPLQNYANETVTTFGTMVTLVSETPMDSLLGTDGADTLVGSNTGQFVYGGVGGYDAITLGSGTDYVAIESGMGGSTSAYASTLTGFSNGTDKFLLGEKSDDTDLTFADLTIAQGTTSADTLISITATSTTAEEFLMHVTGVASSVIDTYDFVSDFA